MLSNWTGLKLHPNFEGDESDDEEDSEEEKREPTGGAQRCSIRKWKNGNYTLLHDADSKERASVDLFIHLLPKKRKGKSNHDSGLSKRGKVGGRTRVCGRAKMDGQMTQ